MIEEKGKRKKEKGKRKKEKDLDFNEIDERLAAGWYVHSGQRKRYLKSIIKDKKSNFILYC